MALGFCPKAAATPATSMTNPSLARLERVYHFFGQQASSGDAAQVPVLADVSLEVRPGQFVCVMGPSGSGKSTLLHVLAGLTRPAAGRVELGGRSLGELGPAEVTRQRRDTVGFVFQFFNLLPNLTVWENVSIPLAIRGEPIAERRGELEGLLQRFGLGARLPALPHQLSGGQMQRVAVARALAGRQPLLLCDEPTGNLSQENGREIMQSLRRAVDDDGRAVLLVTHNPRDAAFADRVLFLIDGRLDPSQALEGPGLDPAKVHAALTALSI
jgi:putative ABC transport system ATP-binding protein